MTDLGSAKILLSAVFIFVGIVVFYISSLISGRNIYKDLEFQHSFIVSVTVGFILFFLLPIGFIVFFPELFDPSLPLTSSANNLKVTILSIHETIFEYAFWPFIMASSGLGIVIGCVTLLKPRWELLSWLRKLTGLGYYLTSYDFTWDHFLARVKPNSMIALQLNDDSWVKGHLQNFSVRKEPKQIVLVNYDIISAPPNDDELREWLEVKVSSDGSTLMDLRFSGQILITEADSMKKIVIQRNALKKHRHELSHAAQSFYCALLSMGLLLLLSSVHCTRDFLLTPFPPMKTTEFMYLEKFYLTTVLIFSILSVTGLWFSIFLIKKDHQTWSSSFILNPSITLLIILIPASPFIVDDLLYNHYFLHPLYYPGIFWLIFLPIVALYVYRVYIPAREVAKRFKSLYDRENREYLTKIITYLCNEMDLNANSQDEYKRLTRLFTQNNYNQNSITDVAKNLFVIIDDLSKKYFSEADQIGLIIKFKSFCQLWNEGSAAINYARPNATNIDV